MKKLFCLQLLCILSFVGFAQTTYYYRGGTFTTAANWNTNPAGGGSAAANFSNALDTWVVTGSNPLTINAAWTVQGRLQVGYLGAGTCTITTNPTINNSIVVAAGGTLNQNVTSTVTVPKMATTQNGTVVFGTGTHSVPAMTFENLTVNSTITATITGAITVNGTLRIDGTVNMGVNTLTAGGSFAVSGTGTLSTQNTTATAIPANRSWSGTVAYTSTGADQTIVNGTYNNLTVGGTTGIKNFTVTSPLTINGNLNFGNTSSTIADGGNTITVAGNITGLGKHSGAGKILMTGNNAFISGMAATGNMELNSADGFSLTGNLVVNGTMTFTNGKLFIDGYTLTIATGGVLSGLNGTSTFIAGGLTGNITVSSTGNIGTLYFDQSGLWSNNVATFSIIGSGATVTMGNTMNVSTLLSITGSATTKLDDNGQTITVTGNISTTAGKHIGTGKISMIGSGGTIQATTAGLQNLELANPAGFTLSGNTIINGTLTFTSGKLALNNKIFTLKGQVAGMSAASCFTGSATSTFITSTSGSTGSLFFDQTTPGTSDNIGTFTNTLGATTLGSNMSVSTLLTLTAGTFDDGGHTVTVTGNVNGTNGSHIGSGKISMAGVGKTIGATVGGLNNVEINNAGGVSLSANTIIKGELSFATGKLALLTRTLTLKGNVTGMSASNSFTGNGASSALTLNSTSDLGTLYFDQTSPGVSNNIATFTMNSAGANATLGNELSVLTTLALTAGELKDGGNTITCMGNITGTGTHSGTGKISMTTATNNSISGATLGNLELNNGTLAFTLTGNTVVNGSLTFTNGSLTIGARTLTVNGAINNMNDAARFFTGSSTSNMVIGTAGTVGPIYFKETTPLTTNYLASLVVNGGGNVLMGNDLSVGNLTLSSGKLGLNNHLLTLKTSFTGSATNCLVGSAAANLTLTNTGNLGTLYFDQTTPGSTDNIYTFFMSGNGGNVTIGNPFSISYLLSITGSTLTTFNDGGNTIRVGGNVSVTNGKHIGTGKLYMTGSGATLQATVGGVNNVQLDNMNGFSLSGNAIVNGTLTFTNGKLSLLARTLTLKNTVEGMSAANSFVGNGATSILTVNSAVDAGTLYFDQTTPGTTDNIATFTLTGGATVTLGSNMSILTTLALTSGTLQDGGNTITSRGSITGTGTHTGSGKISITNISKTIGSVTLGNVELNNAGITSIATGSSPQINGTLTFTNGTFSIGANRLTLNGNVAGLGTTRYITGGASSDLVIGSTGNLGDLYFNVSSVTNRTLRNLILNGGGSATLKTALAVSTELALTNGTLNDGGNVITLSGNITGNGTHLSTGSGNITMGGVSKTISGVTLGNLILNNAVGFTLTGDATVNGTLTLTSGRLVLGANSLTLGASATIAGTLSSAKMIVTNGTGQLKKVFTAAGSYTFPIGDNTPNYTPVTINVTGGSFAAGSVVGASVTNTKHPANFNANNYLKRYWHVSTENIGSPVYNVTANYLATDIAGTEAAISMGEYPDSAPWTKYGTVNTGSHTLTYTGLTHTSTNLSGITTAGPSVFVTPNNVNAGCDPVDLTATGAGDPTMTYSWSPATRLSATTGSVVTAFPNTAIVYTVTATDGNGFTAQATATVVGTINTWQGTTSAWNTASNWSCGSVPTATNDVIIPVTANAPMIPAAANVSAFNVTLSSSVALTLGAGATFNVKGDVINNGTITGPSTAKVILNGSSAQSLSGNGNVYNLELNNTAGASIGNGSTDTVTVKGALTLTSGNLATNNRLMLFANASGAARVAPITGGSITGNVVNQTYVPSPGHAAWHFMSHPFNNYIALNQMLPYIDLTGSGGTSNGWSSAPFTDASVYWVKQSSGGWVPFTNANANTADNQFKRHQGIRIFIWGAKGEGIWGGSASSPVTVRTYGELNTGDQTVTMTKASTDYNQLGNPYASPVDIGTVLKAAYDLGKLFNTSYYVWNPALGTNGQYVTKINDGTPFYIPAGGAFQVRTAADGNTLNFTEANKGTTASIAFRTYTDQLTLTIFDGNYHPWDMVSVKFSQDAAEAEEKIDASKPESPADLNFYSLSAEKTKLSMDVRPFSNGKVIPLGINTTQQREFIIKASNVVIPEAGSAVYLKDKFLGKVVMLSNDAEYKFSINEDPTSQGDNRFELSMEPIKSIAEMVSTKVSVMPNPTKGDITVDYTVTGKENTVISVINVAGEVIMTKDAGAAKMGKVAISLGNIPAGVYMVSVSCGNEKVVRTLVKE